MATGDPGDGQRRTGVWVACGMMILIFGFTVALSRPAFADKGNPFWFVGMLVIFGAALALIAVVFRWLGIAAPDEAFALPSGSIRTLLAVGVMVLFSVFGLSALSVNESSFTKRVSDTFVTAVAPAASGALAAEIARYDKQGISAIPEKIEGDTATLQLRRIEPVKPAGTADMEKQLITALVTLLTSVVSFYFGSRSAEVALDAKVKADGVTPTPTPTPKSDATPAVDLAALDTAIASAATRLAALQSETATAGNESALVDALKTLPDELAAVQAARGQLDTAIADAATQGGAPPTEAVAALRQQVEALAARLGSAEALVAKG